jgi:hypothetical protein
MRLQSKSWDYKAWIITILTTLALAGGGYTVKTLAEANAATRQEVEAVKQRAADLTARQSVDDERYTKIQADMKEIKESVKDVRDLLIKTHMKELKEERPLPKK